jgi:antirestriction protein ArdC
MNTNELRQSITNQIAEALKSGDKPFWKRPWTNDSNCGAPVNIVTKRPYKGMNPLLLTLASLKHGYTSRYWASYQQWREMGGQVNKGEKGTIIVFYRVLEKEVSHADGEKQTRKFFVLRYWNVFNLQQVAGDALDKYRPGQTDGQQPMPLADWTPADELSAATKADIRYGGNKAFYSPAGDFIQIPLRQQFPDVRDFYDTHFHELSHWSQAASRLNFKDSYAFGELVAELTAAFVSWQLALPQSQDLTNHQAYLASWLEAMNNDPKWIFHAAAAASKSADYLLALANKVEADPQPEAIEAVETVEAA